MCRYEFGKTSATAVLLLLLVLGCSRSTTAADRPAADTATGAVTIEITGEPDDGNWAEFRGSRGDGRSDDAKLPVAIDESVVRWQTPIDGKGDLC